MDIKDYIYASRFCKKEKSYELARTYYQDFYNKIQEKEDIKLPDLEVCYTTERTCEFIRFKEQTYIIYDQYIGQTLNMFNRIFYNSTDKMDAIIYAYKYYAEIFHYKADRKMTFASISAYLINKEKMKSYKNETDLIKRLNTTLIQEKFILLHEIYHYKFSLLSHEIKQEKINRKKLEILGYMIADKQTDIDPKVIMKYAIQDTFELDSDEFKSFLKDEKGKAFLKKLYKRYKKMKNVDMYGTLFERDDLVEEILCDEYALIQLLKYEEITFCSIACMVFIAIESLGTMTMMKNSVVHYMDYEDSYLVDIAIRKVAFRKIAAMKQAMLRKINIEKLQKDIVAVNERFSKIIRDPIMVFALGSIKDVAELDIPENEVSRNIDEWIATL